MSLMKEVVYMKQLYVIFSLCIINSFMFALDIVYEERIPYVQKQDNTVIGLVATPALKALTQANVEFNLKEKPSKRHLVEIESNQNEICALGWFKNPTRETFAKFTKALYKDEPMGIIARNEDINTFNEINIEQLLSKKLVLLTKASYSYGTYIDEKIANMGTKKIEVYSTNEKMLLLISKKRGDYMFMSYEEASLFLNQPEFQTLKFYKIKEMPEGNSRYLICSKQVSEDTISRINQYIE